MEIEEKRNKNLSALNDLCSIIKTADVIGFSIL